MDNNKKKTSIKRILIISISVIIPVLLIFPIIYLITILSMKPIETGEIITDVYAVKSSFSNFYLVNSDGKYIAFDAGVDIDSTKKALDSLGIEASDVTAIFLTHTDNDHVIAIDLFSEADIYMAESNKSFLDSDIGRFRSQAFVDMKRKYMTLNDGETITVNDIQIQCIFTPGHTDGSASYIVNDNLLFTGDNMHLKDGKAVLFSSIFNMSDEIQKLSIKNLSMLEGIDAVFTMHTGYTTDFKTAFEEW